MQALVLEPKEKDQVVEITAAKLHEILSAGVYNKCSAMLGSLELYKNIADNRTKTVTFMANHKQEQIDLIHGQLLDSPKDYEAMKCMNDHMEDVHKDFLNKQHNPERD